LAAASLNSGDGSDSALTQASFFERSPLLATAPNSAYSVRFMVLSDAAE
jgi:hypothetical protein